METPDELPKLRVAAYCRVSTQEEQQVGSFDMQVLHFTKRIEGNPNWILVEIYQDEGISATTVEKRLGFQKMIADAVDGKIDLILTKSISLPAVIIPEESCTRANSPCPAAARNCGTLSRCALNPARL